MWLSDFSNLNDPIPALPLKGKGDQPHKPQLWQVRRHSPPSGELEGVFGNDYFNES
jgi:hypothetical protein